MNYNEMFRVFDNGGETVDRYTVFLADDPELGGLGLSDDPAHAQHGFSQWGEFDPDVVSRKDVEIAFDELPRNVQAHVIDRFGVNEDFDQTDEDILEEVIFCVLHEELDTAKELMQGLIADKVSRRANQLNELKLGAVKFVGDDVFVNGKKVGTIENDLDDFDRGIVFRVDETGEEADFEKVEDLIKHIFDVFRIKESVDEYIVEATQQQKGVVKALRQLARKLKIPSPRFRSLNGKAGFVEMSSNEGEIPNKLREQIVTKVFRTVPMNFSDVDYGNVTKHSIGLTVGQWKQLLAYYGIEVPEPMMEGYRILPPIDRDRYQEREGLEGPFRARNGKVVYYDPKEGKYYDPDSDWYISFEEWEEMDRDPELRR
jgi:hypothetical protein